MFASVAIHAQQADRAKALDEQIDRIFQAREHDVPRFGPARWLPDGISYSTIEPSTELPGSSDIVRYDAESGARNVLVAGVRLVPPGKTVGGGVALDGWILKPSSFDRTRKYPVIVHMYGEPARVTVTDRWGGGRMLFHRALADAGYVVVSVDNRGTPAPKGAAWRKIIYGTVGDSSSRDQAAAVRALVARFPFLDGDRVGVWLHGRPHGSGSHRQVTWLADGHRRGNRRSEMEVPVAAAAGRGRHDDRRQHRHDRRVDRRFHHARSGTVLYRFNTGGPMGGGIVTYAVGGKQYIAAASGSPSNSWVERNPGAPTIVIFALPGNPRS